MTKTRPEELSGATASVHTHLVSTKTALSVRQLPCHTVGKATIRALRLCTKTLFTRTHNAGYGKAPGTTPVHLLLFYAVFNFTELTLFLDSDLAEP